MEARHTLPNRRESYIIDFEHRNMPFTVGYSFFKESGNLAEIFVQPRLPSSDLHDELGSASTILSISLQYDVPLSTIRSGLPKHANNRPCCIIGKALTAIASAQNIE
jgi:hypothetical protein